MLQIQSGILSICKVSLWHHQQISEHWPFIYCHLPGLVLDSLFLTIPISQFSGFISSSTASCTSQISLISWFMTRLKYLDHVDDDLGCLDRGTKSLFPVLNESRKTKTVLPGLLSFLWSRISVFIHNDEASTRYLVLHTSHQLADDLKCYKNAGNDGWGGGCGIQYQPWPTVAAVVTAAAVHLAFWCL